MASNGSGASVADLNSLRADTRDAARAQVVAAALCNGNGSVLHTYRKIVMAREAKLADRVAAAMQV